MDTEGWWARRCNNHDNGVQMKIEMVVLWAAAMVLPPAQAVAQGFKPTRPVEIVVHTGPGGGNDVLARVVNGIFEKEGLLPVRANVFNKPGGGGAVAMAYLAEKAGQPHTIAFYSTLWITISLTSREARVQFHELTPIANLVLDPAVVVVRADSPYKTLGDFIQEAGFNIPNVRTVRGVVGPPRLPKDAVEYWENVFARMVKTDAWRRYLADNHVEDWYLKSAELGKFAEEIAVQRREIFRELGIKTAR